MNWKGSGRVVMEVTSQNLAGGTSEWYENRQLG
jgi:hypothetical protein